MTLEWNGKPHRAEHYQFTGARHGRLPLVQSSST